MTNAIEQSKREMYKQLNLMKKNADVLALPPLEAMLGNFESAFEAYLEESRQDSEALHQTARKRFEDIQSLEAVNAELTERLSLMTTDRDSLRNRMQAYEAREAPASTSGQTSGENASCAPQGSQKPAKICMHSFFAIGNDQMKCTFCGVVE